MSELHLMFSIVNRRQVRRFQDLYDEVGASLALTTLGRGTAASDILDYFGLAATEKAVLLHFVTRETWKPQKPACRNSCTSTCPVPVSLLSFR